MSLFKRASKRIYADNAALTPTDRRVVETVHKYMSGAYGNPSSLSAEGVAAKKAVEDARKKSARFFSAHPDEIIFTSSGTESNNLAIRGAINALLGTGKKLHELHLIISAIEHPSVMELAYELQREGMMLDCIPVDSRGLVNPHEVKEKLRKETALVSIMTVNNEIGTIQPIKEIAKVIRHFKKHNSGALPLVFHTDASQAPLYIDPNVQQLGVDLLTIDSHKVYGPKGVGLLYKKRTTDLAPIIFGGGQEQGLRSGTENVPGICGLAHALMIAQEERDKETSRLSALRDYCIHELLHKIPGAVLNGDPNLRIANNVNISIPGIDNEFVVLELDALGIACSTKSSCLKDEDESYVMKAIGNAHKNALRFSFGRYTTEKDINTIIKTLVELTTTR